MSSSALVNFTTAATSRPPAPARSEGPSTLDVLGGFAANSPVFAAAATRTLERSADAKDHLAHASSAAEQRVAPVSNAEKKRTTLLDLECGATSVLRHPPEVNVQPTAASAAPAPAPTMAEVPLGQCIARLLAEYPPGQRPPSVVAQLRHFLDPLPYLEPEPRRACLEQLCQLAGVHVAVAGEMLARQGETGSSLFLVLSGRCSLHLDLARDPLPRWHPHDDEDNEDDDDYAAVGMAHGGAGSDADDVTLLARALRESRGAAQGGAAPGGEDMSCRSEVAVAATVASSTPAAQLEPQLLTVELGGVLAILEPGDAFGERSCLLRAPRGSTLVSLEASTQLLTLERRHARRLYGCSPPLASKLATLASLQLPLTVRHAHCFRTRHVASGGLILRHGQPLVEWMLVWSGGACLRVVHQHESTEFAHVCPGGCLADEILLAIAAGSSPGGGSPRASSTVSTSPAGCNGKRRAAPSSVPMAQAAHEAIAIEATTLLVISADALLRLPPATLAALAEAAAERQRHRDGVRKAMAAQRSARATSRANAMQRAKAAMAELNLEPLAASPVSDSSFTGEHVTEPPSLRSVSSSAAPAARLDASGALAAGVENNRRLRPSTSAGPGLDSHKLVAPALDRLKDAARVLVYGPEAVLDSEIAGRCARRFQQRQRAMEHVVARRSLHGHPDDCATRRRDGLPAREMPRAQFRELANEHATIVSEIRPLPPERMLADLKQQTLDARLRADRLPFVPPSHATSMFVQLRRLGMEREASSKKAKLYLMGASAGTFLRKPTDACGTGKPSLISTARDAFPRMDLPDAIAAADEHAWNIF